MLDEELSTNAPECAENAEEKQFNGNLQSFDSERGRAAANKRWSTKKFANVRNYIKQTMAGEIEKRAEAIAKANADFMEAGNLDGVRAIREGFEL